MIITIEKLLLYQQTYDRGCETSLIFFTS